MKWDSEERFAFSTPYIKLNADPDEMYLNMLNGAGLLNGNEIDKLNQLHDKIVARVNSLPNHAWIIEPVLPDIIKEFIVSSFLKENDVIGFTKLARSNSIMGLSTFIIRAVEDWPENKIFQKIMITPPDEVLNYFEFYISLLIKPNVIEDFKPVEKALIDVDKVFPRYELELWRRIVYVLENRGDTLKLYESALRFLKYLKKFENKLKIRDEAADILRQYCLILHNTGHEDEFIATVDKIGEISHIFPKNKTFGLLLCENYRVIIAGKFYAGKDFCKEWQQIQKILEEFECSTELMAMAMKAANHNMLSLIHNCDIKSLIELEQYLERLQDKCHSVFIAETAALTTSNIYTLNDIQNHKILTEEYEKLKTYLQEYPDSKKVRSAYITITKEEFLKTSEYRQVPDKILNMAKDWSKNYSDEIEFPEAYFGLLLAKLEYAQAHNMRKEYRTLIRKMKDVAVKTNYSEYHEENSMIEVVNMLQMLYWD